MLVVEGPAGIGKTSLLAASSGMTNRQIAQSLFVTADTVETHLTSVCRKLECRSRAELPRYLERAVAA